jgi:type II secretion system protein G
MRLDLITITALGAILAGCASPQPTNSLAQAPARRTAVATQKVVLPAGQLAPVDRWRRDLMLVLPSPWRLDRIEAQVVAPEGWTRISGDRGLALWVTDGAQQQVFWIMPQDFDGRPTQPDVLARQVGKSDAFTLWEPKVAAEGWTATAQIAVGLGFESGLQVRRSKLARSSAETAIATISTALERFKGDHSVYPVRLRDLWQKPVQAGARWKGPYLESGASYDPWGGDFVYTSTPFSFELVSYGADGVPGGTEDDQDVVFK